VEVWQKLPWYRRHALHAADALVAISQYTAERFAVVQGANPDRVRVLPLGLEPAFWAFAQWPDRLERPAELPSGRILLSVARLSAVDAYKGIDTLIQALARLPDDTHLVVVGDGDDRPRLEALAHAEGVSRRVHFLGALEGDKLAACYQHCDIFALPSKGEGFGLVFLEAMAFGKPVVGGAHGGTLDVIEHGKSGFLVPHGDVDQLAATLARLLADPALCAEIGHRARQRVEQHYLFPQFESRLRKILDELTGQ
jgi:glycosyltransferase involved in cell wall biosynthesis